MPIKTIRRAKRPLSFKEKGLIFLACMQLGLAIWAMALTHLWSEVLFASLSVTGFVVCLLPQQKDLRWQDPLQTTSAAWQRLKRFPLFWAGIVLLLYIAIQGLNPAYGYEENPQTWRAFPVEHISWSPSSVASPFYKLNPWRMIMVLGAAWLFLCYTYTGLQRHRSLSFLMWFVFFNALAFCVLTLIQKQTKASGIYWNYEVYPNFFGTVPYKNRGAAVLYLMMGISMALYFYEAKAMREKMLKSGPHLIVLLGLFFQYAVIWTSLSRGGLAVATGMMLVFFLFVSLNGIRENDSPLLKILGATTGIILVVFATIAFPKLPGFERSLKRFNTVEAEIASGHFNGRGPATRITVEMIQHKPWFGWGAGSWRFVFPYYQLRHPEMKFMKDGKTLAIWHDAHNDWAQYISELGLVGTPIAVSFFLWPIGFIIWRIRRSRATHFILGATLLGLLNHALIELLLQNLAILGIGACLVSLCLRLPFNRAKQDELQYLDGSNAN